MSFSIAVRLLMQIFISSANTLNFQLYLLEGLNRWNQDRAAASLVTKPSTLLTYAGDVVQCLNTNSLKVTFQPPAKYTGKSHCRAQAFNDHLS